jgi:hypothetical protein
MTSAPVTDVCDEIHGMADARTSASQHALTVCAHGKWIEVDKTTMSPVCLTPDQARYFATKLRRCAAIVEQRRASGQS